MRLVTATFAALAFLTIAAAPLGPAGKANVEALAWMSGSWVAIDGETWTEEHWTMPRGGAMLGTNLSSRDEDAKGFEFLRIAADADGKIHYWASPGGRAPVAFRLVAASDDEAFFENPENDFPTRIAYRREGNVLTATISGPDGANMMSWIFRRR